jgi:2',3'-cyclic-nucleotide 2'-phosphodiesterase (5'-nucleotidase family)
LTLALSIEYRLVYAQLVELVSMDFSRVALLFIFCHLATAKQPSAPSAVAAPLRELPWGQINFLHTTDTHGWHGGHLQEPQYSADWGDYISFASHLQDRADKDGSDLLLIDTGDRVEGNGLYDASNPKGSYTRSIFTEQPMSVITIGNHELYKNSTSALEYDNMVPAYKDSFIASNLNIRDAKTGKYVPFGARYRKFTTKNQKIRVLAMGFIYNFQGNANNTQVQQVQETVKEEWFLDAIRSRDVDLFLVAGHVALRNSTDREYDRIYDAIRREQWDTPIVFFGGHSHIRDFKHYGQSTEKKAYGIESGRYFETIGFLSISGVSTKGAAITRASPKYERLYIDNNLYSLHQHSNTTAGTFDTKHGQKTSQAIADARKALKLDKAFGCAPKDYWLYRSPYPSKSSLLTLLDQEILPDTFTNEKSSEHPTIVMTNSGAVRFDIFKGAFTTDTTYIVCPFTSAFRMIKNVPYEPATKVIGLLNSFGPIVLGDDEVSESTFRDVFLPKPPQLPGVPSAFQAYLDFTTPDQQPLVFKPDLTPGYTTKDDLGNDGDDTLHSPLPAYNIPNVVGANIGFKPDPNDVDKLPETVDVVYNEYIQMFVLAALRALGVSYGEENTRLALDGKSMTDVISGWVEQTWACED